MEWREAIGRQGRKQRNQPQKSLAVTLGKEDRAWSRRLEENVGRTVRIGVEEKERSQG